MEKLLKNKIIITILALLLTSFVACSDEPNAVGVGLIPDKDKLTFESIDSYTSGFSQSFESFKKDSLKFGSTSPVLLGNYKNISIDMLIGFLISLPDSIKEPFTTGEAKLLSCWIEAEPTYWIGDSNNFSFTLHRINSSWNPAIITQDTIDEINNKLGPNLLDASTYSFVDTLMKFDVNKDLVEGWTRRTFDSSYEKDYGMLLRSNSSSAIVGFQALTSFPYAEYPKLYMVFEKPGVFIDTLVAIPSSDLHIPTGVILQNTSQSIILQSTLGVRGKLKFDLSMVPENILINKADLDLFIDTDNSEEGSVKTDTIAISLLKKFEDATLSSSIGRYPLLRKDNKYTGDIRAFVQNWINGEINEGVQLQLSDELRSVSKVAIYNTFAVDSLRPRLTIYYTKN